MAKSNIPIDTVFIGLVLTAAVAVVLYQMVPVIGETTDNIIDIETQTKATGVLTFSNQPADGETFNISTDRYEYDTGDGVAGGNFDINVGGTLVATLGATVTCVNANDTAGVNATNSTTTLNLTADAFGTAGNAIATTETITNAAFGATTLTGGLDGSQWDYDTNSDLPVASDLWITLGGLSVLALVLTGIGISIRGLMKITKT